MPQFALALKVDVDTYVGTRDGVPRLLDLFDRFGIKATFYFSLGPDNSGKAIRRIFTRKGFLGKMLRTRAPSMYGLKTLLYGTVLPAPMIGASFPSILQAAAHRGHEIGVHCWDHVKWHDCLPRMSPEKIALEMGQARALLSRIIGHDITTTAAPGWTVSVDSLAFQDTLGLTYCSDTRGTRPFYPRFGGCQFKTLQVPTTFPTMDELLGLNGITLDSINHYYVSQVQPGLNVHTIHAELEGMALLGTFTELLEKLIDRHIHFITLADAAREAVRQSPPVCSLAMEQIVGRAGLVALQDCPN